MKILITGCAGFIGRRLAAQFAREHEVYGATRQMAGLPAGVMPVIADLSVPSMLCGLAQGGVLPDAIDAVLHFAQSSRYREWPDGADDMFAVNVGATQRLLEYARRAGAQRFIMASTGSVYLPSAMALREDSPTSAKGYYAASKLAAEALLCAYDGLLPTLALRLFFPYGAGQRERLVADLIGRVRDGRAITLSGDGGGLVFNPTHVDDIVAVAEQAIHAGWRGLLNVASSTSVSLREVGDTIAGRLGKTAIFEHIPAPAGLPLIPDISRLAGLWPACRFRSFADGLRETIDGEGA